MYLLEGSISMTEQKGFLKTWKDDRGFGFIKPEDGSDDIFIHISALKGFVRRPYRGDTIFYQIEQADDGKTKAVSARIEGVNAYSEEKTSTHWVWVVAIILALAVVAGVVYFGLQQ